MKYLLLTIDPTQFPSILYPSNTVHQSITDFQGDNDWWHYLPNVYILQTRVNEKDVADYIQNRHPGLRFLVIKADIAGANGILHQRAWDWFNTKTNKYSGYTPAAEIPKLDIMKLLAESVENKKKQQKQAQKALSDFLKNNPNSK